MTILEQTTPSMHALPGTQVGGALKMSFLLRWQLFRIGYFQGERKSICIYIYVRSSICKYTLMYIYVNIIYNM